jgi:hypothetical protein
MGADATQRLLERATAIALAAAALGQRLLDIIRGQEAPWSIREPGSKPPEPQWSQLLDALGGVEPLIGLATDPALNVVKEKLKAIGRRVNQCLHLPKFDPDHLLLSWGPEFNTEGLALWQAIQAVPRHEPGYAAWAEEDIPLGQEPAPDNGSAAAGDASSEGAAEPIEPPAPTAPSDNAPTPPNTNDEEFLEFTVKQRKLLKALQHKGAVPMDEVKMAVYGTKRIATSTLEQLITRTNKGLADRNHALEIKRKANTCCLSPL